MNAISNVNNGIVEAHLSSVQVRQQIDVAVAVKASDAMRSQGTAALKLLVEAMELAQPVTDEDGHIDLRA